MPAYITRLLTRISDLHSRNTRYANYNLVCANYNLVCPKFKRKLDGGKTFNVTTCQLWNSLPITIRQMTSILSFTKALKQFFSRKPKEFESFFSLICFYFLVSWLCHLILEIYFISDFIKRFTNNTHEQVVKT